MRAVIYAMGSRTLEYAFWDQEREGETLPLMTDEQILDVRADGFEIGAHTMTHPDLTRLTHQEQIEEIVASKDSLENLLGEELTSFAYPFGRVDRSSHIITQKAGFKFACGVYSGPPRFGDDIFNIRRLGIGYNTGLLTFLMKLTTPYEYLEWFNYKLKHRSSASDDFLSEHDLPAIDYEATLKNNFEKSSPHS